MKTFNKKKGFTIVELVIVVAVIGVLTAILVPTFVNLTNKANQAADESLVKNLNTQLRIKEQTEGKNKTLTGALEDAKEGGYLIENLTPRGNKDIVWNQDKDEFSLLEEAPAADAYKYWKIYEKAADVPATQTYSIYGKGTEWTTVPTLTVGFDAGENEGIAALNFETELERTVTIRTNGTGTALTVNAPNSVVNHYDFLDGLTVTAVKGDSYHEWGAVKGKAVLSKGHIEIEQGASVPEVSVENATGQVKVTANEKTIISVDETSQSQTTVVAKNDNVFVSGLSEEKITGNAVVAEQANSKDSLLIALSNGYAQLNADVTVDDNLTISKAAVIDLNGHTLVVNGLVLNNGDLTITDSKDNGQKKVSNVVNDSVVAVTSTGVKTEASITYTKNLQGTLKAESIITSSNHSLTVLNGSFVSELDYHKYYGTSNETDGMIYVAENANAVIYNGAFFSENLEDATEQYAAAAVAVIANRGNTTIYKGEFVTKYCRETYDPYFDGKAHVSPESGLYNKDRMQYSYYTISSYGGSMTISPKTNNDITVYAARGALSFNAGTAKVNGGAFYAYHYYAAYIAGSSGHVKGTIAGGEFNLINEGSGGASYALYIGNDSVGDGGKRRPANVVVLDCLVKSNKKAINVANSTGTIVLYGGKYDKPISESYIDQDNYKIVQEDGYYVVKAK